MFKAFREWLTSSERDELVIDAWVFKGVAVAMTT